MTTPEPQAADVDELYRQLFGDALAPDDLVSWYRTLTYRASVLQAVLDRAQRQRAQTVAHMADTLGWTHKTISTTLGDLNPSRAGQLVARGRKTDNYQPRNPSDYGGTR